MELIICKLYFFAYGAWTKLLWIDSVNQSIILNLNTAIITVRSNNVKKTLYMQACPLQNMDTFYYIGNAVYYNNLCLFLNLYYRLTLIYCMMCYALGGPNKFNYNVVIKTENED